MDESQASDYRATLAELTSNNKNTINLLTILADDYSDSASQIVRIIEDHLYSVPRDQKLAVMYLADSIVKNVTTHYRDLFSRVIVKMFVHVFKSCDERVRLSLYKLRQTWADTFPKGKLYELDLKVHEEDSAWPVQLVGRPTAPAAPVRPVIPPTTSGQVHINPRFIERAVTTTTNTTRSDPRVSRTATRTVIGDSKELRVEVKGVKEETLPPATVSTSNTPSSQPSSLPIKTEPPEETPAEPKPSDPPIVKPVKEVKKEVVERPERNRKRESEERRDRDRRKHETAKERSPPPKHARHTSPRPENRRRHNNGAITKPPMSNTMVGKGRGNVIAAPTNVVGSHAFTVPPRMPSTQPSPPLPRPLMSTPPLMGLHTDLTAVPRPENMNSAPSGPSPLSLIPPLIPSISLPFHPSSSIPGLMSVAPSNPFGPNRMIPPIAPMQPNIPPPSIPSSLPSIPPPLPMPPLSRSNPAMMERKHVIRDDNRLEGIPANNRIFVDGKAYEVLYIGDTAVIERDGLPHRIYFTGAPRNVVIDGRPHMLGFGEKRDVMVDGDMHTIRFGAPSRELYMGDFAFKGAFGGPPIFATINGVRHEIRLSGPAPEVKIEPEPCYELHRFLQQARSGHRPLPPIAPLKPEVKNSTDITGLLAKLKESGILNSLKEKKETNNKWKVPSTEESSPIPSEIRGTGERATAPHPLFEKDPFDMRFLKTRYDSIISSLLATRSVCPHCGLRFDTLTKEGTEKHLDWHVKKNLSASTTRESRARLWYGSVKDWTEAKDTVEDEETGEGLGGEKTSGLINAPAESAEVKASVASNDAVSKVCAVCGDTLQEYFDEDDDEWRLKNCVQVDARICHESCAMDASRLDEDEPSVVAVKME